MKKAKEYIIQGRFVDNNWYLYTLVLGNLEDAKKALKDVIANPARYCPHHHLYKDFRILEVNSCQCWWNQGGLD